jgi:hypothetical protein
MGQPDRLQSGFPLQGFLLNTRYNLDMCTGPIKALCRSNQGATVCTSLCVPNVVPCNKGRVWHCCGCQYNHM